jgi:hypothetical protein
MEYPHFPWGLGRLSDAELAVNCADAIANGGDLWFPMYAPDDADREGWDALKGIFAELDGVRPANAVQLAPAAVLFSRLTAERYGAADVEEHYLDDAIGTIQLVRELGLPYRVLAEDTLTETDLAETQILFVPTAAVLRAESTQRIRNWVAAGGVLIATGWLATHDERGALVGDSALSDVLGVRLGPGTVHTGMGYLVAHATSGLPEGAKVPVRDEQPSVEVRTAEPLLDAMPSWELFAPPADVPPVPSVTRNRFGEGVAIYCGIQLGRLRRRFELFEARRIVRHLLAASGASEMPVIGSEIGPEVGLHVWRAGNEVRIMLVNFTSLEATGEAATLGRQSVRIDRALLPPDAWVVSHRGNPVHVTAKDNHLVITAETLEEWDCLIAKP